MSRKLKTRGQHPNDGVTIATDRQILADNVGIAAKSSLPQAVGQNRDLWTILVVFSVLKCSTDDGIDSQD